MDASGFGDTLKHYIASNIQTRSHKIQSLNALYIAVSSSLMAGSKAFDDSSVYLTVVKLRQPSIYQRTIAIRSHLGCSLINVKALSKQILCKDYLTELMSHL